MIYADTDFFLALVKDDDWLSGRAEKMLKEHEDEIYTGLPTFIELFYLSEDYEIELEKAMAHILEIADTRVEDSVLFQALENKEKGMTVMDAFQAALADESIISSDKSFDKLSMERIKLEEKN